MPFKKQEKKRKNKRQFKPKKLNNHSSDEKNHSGTGATESKSVENQVIQYSKVNQKEDASQIIGDKLIDTKLTLPPDENFGEAVEKVVKHLKPVTKQSQLRYNECAKETKLREIPGLLETFDPNVKISNAAKDIVRNNLVVETVNVHKTIKSTKTKTKVSSNDNNNAKAIAGPAIPAIKHRVENISPSSPAKEILSTPTKEILLPLQEILLPQQEILLPPQDYKQLQKEFEEYKKKKENEIQQLLHTTAAKQLDLNALIKQKNKLEQNLNKMREKEKENARELELKVRNCESKVVKIQQAYKQLNDEKFAALEKQIRVSFENSLLNQKLTSVQKELLINEEQIMKFKNQLIEANINKKLLDLEAGIKTGESDVKRFKDENGILKEKLVAFEKKAQVSEVNNSLLRDENAFLKKRLLDLEEKAQVSDFNINLMRDANTVIKKNVLVLKEEVKAYEISINVFRDENSALKENLLIWNEEDQRKNERLIEVNEQRQEEKETFIQQIEDLRKLSKEKEDIIEKIKNEKEITKEEAFFEGNEKLIIQKLNLDAKHEIEIRKLNEKHLKELDRQKLNNTKQITKIKKEINDINDLEKQITVSHHETRYNQMQELNQNKVDQMRELNQNKINHIQDLNQNKIDRITSSVQTLQNYIDQKVATACVFKLKKLNPIKISTFVTNIKKEIHYVNKK